MAAKTQQNKLLPLLYFGGGRVEWIPRPGSLENGYCRDETASRAPEDMVRVARGLVREGGDKPGACIVLLGGDQVRQRTYSLGQIPAKERTAVLRRKAANLVEVEEHQVVFSALPLATHDGELDSRWLVAALRTDDLRSLQRQLLNDGFSPKRILFARQAMLLTAESELSTGSDDEAWVIVGVEELGVSISLVAAGQLVQQSFVPGQFTAKNAMAASVLQEMRGFESYWRRFSRGGAIDDVYVAGLTQEDAEHFQIACHAALPNAEFEAIASDQALEPDQARAAYLVACASGSGAAGDFTLPRPIQRKGMVATAVGTLCLGLLFGREAQANLKQATLNKLDRVAMFESDVPNLAGIESDLDRLQQGMDELELRGQLAALVGTAGIELRDWQEVTREAFEGRAILENLHVDDTGGEVSYSAGGRVSADPTESTLALAGISEALRSVQALASFRLRLPTTVNGTSTGREGLEFRVTASIRNNAGMQ